MAGALACEVVVAVGSVAADFVAEAFAAGFVSGVVLAAGFAGVEVAEESCVAMEVGACCAPGVEACWARAGDKKIAPAASVVRARAPIKVDRSKKVGFCILIFWHPEPARANE